MLALALLAACPVAVPQDDLLESLDAYFTPLVESGLFAGSVLVVRGDERLARAYGEANLAAGAPNTIDTRYKLMSTSKPFTALAVMTLVEEERLTLDDCVAEHLGGWPEVWGAITVRDLMAHTTGLPNLEALLFPLEREKGRQVSWGVLAGALKDAKAGGERGKSFAYSNFHYVVLGCLLEELTGEALPDVITERVLEPAGMHATGFDDGGRPTELSIGYFWDPDGDPDPSFQDMSGIQGAGGLWSSVRDLGRLHDALRVHAIVGAEAWAEMTRLLVTPMSSGWFRNPVAGHECIGHSGGANGYVADFLHFPADDACVVVQSNYAFVPVTRISHDVARFAFGEAVEGWAQPAAEDLRRCAGVYGAQFSDDWVLVRMVGKTLSLCRGQNEGRWLSAPLIPLGARSFLSGRGERMDFDGEGGLQVGSARYSRLAVDDSEWREAAGGYGSPERAVYLSHVEGRFELRVMWDIQTDYVVVPVDTHEALVLSYTGSATRMRLDADGGDRRLAWTRYGRVNDLRAAPGVERPRTIATCAWCTADLLEGTPLFTCDDGCSYCRRCEDWNDGICPKGGGSLKSTN